MARYSPTERIGVNAVERIVLDELHWIFREQPIVDMGIDAHVELADEGNPTGKLIALQIKTGKSHFHEMKDELIYYGRLEHLDYWTGHSLPVVLVAHLPESDTTLWSLVGETDVQRTDKSWKISIPKTNKFGRETLDRLAVIFEGPPIQQRLRKLSIDEPLMRHIKSGGKVSVDLQHWVNKSLGRTPVKVFVHDTDGKETLSQDWFQYYTGYGMKELAEVLFPWATATVDTEFYDEHGDFAEEWHSRDHNVIYPYKEAVAGEVDCYRLQFKLNKLGRAFLTLSDHLSGRDGGGKETD